MALLDLLGRRWALRILWELRDGGSPTFRELQAKCGGISSSVLSDRLRELREAGIVEATGAGGYGLTSDGHSLLSALEPIDAWAKRWAKRGPAKAAGSSRDPQPKMAEHGDLGRVHLPAQRPSVH